MKTTNRIVTAVAGGMLIIASVLKSYQLLTEPIITPSFWESWAFFVMQIPLELGLGIWLLSGLFRKAAWLVGVAAFGIFIIVTLQKGLAGDESCGCFGPVHVNPWITLSTIDVTLFLGLLIFRPRGEKLLPPPWPSAKHFFGVAIPTFILLGILVPVLILNKPPDKTSEYEVVRTEEWEKKSSTNQEQTGNESTSIKSADANEEQPGGKQAVPEPNDEEWPLLRHIDIADSLRSGIAIVLLYHNDCPDCREAIPRYDRMSRELAGGEDAMRFAFIEIPPYGPEEDSPVPADTLCLKGKLDTSKQWYITSPLVVLTLNGSVIESWQAEAPTEGEILNALFAGSR